MAEKNIYQKLQHIQTNLKAPKNQRNEFGKYNYRNCEDILEAVKPIMNDVGCVLTISDKINMIGDRYYVEATATLIDSESCATISNTAYAREEQDKKGMDASQITGSTSSYARKYALNGLFCIDDTKDADSADNTQGGKQEKPKDAAPVKVGQEHINALFVELQRTGVGIKGIMQCYKISDIHDMTIDQFRDAMDKLKKKPDKKPDPATIPPETEEEGLPWNTPAR